MREAARLHSYPDWFRFHATKWHGFRQIGNSVPPYLARAVASQLIEALGVKPTKPAAMTALGDVALLSISMSDAAHMFGVPNNVISRRRRPHAQAASELADTLAAAETKELEFA